MNPVLSIVVVEYKGIDEVRDCVASIQQKLQLPHEVIVSSNSCYDEATRQAIPMLGENVKWVFNERNGGFAYAMNEGLKQASGDFLVIMNSDCIIKSGIDQMVDFMRQHTEVGAIAPRFEDANGRVQDTARDYVSLPGFLFRQVRRVVRFGYGDASILTISFDYGRVQTVDWVIGAFIMVSRKAYQLTGGLDDNYFMYAEDVDWCTRIRQQGLEVVYYPKAVINYEGTRRARVSLRYARIFAKSHLHYWRKFGFCSGYPKRKELNL